MEGTALKGLEIGRGMAIGLHQDVLEARPLDGRLCVALGEFQTAVNEASMSDATEDHHKDGEENGVEHLGYDDSGYGISFCLCGVVLSLVRCYKSLLKCLVDGLRERRNGI